MKIIDEVKREIEYCEGTALNQNPSFAKTQPSLLNLIDLYYLSKYKDGDRDSLGQKKVFYNISTFPVEVASKMLDLDTKNIYIMSTDKSYWTSWVMQKELEMWFKDKYFGTQLNLYPHYLAKYGHLVVKKVDDEVVIVPLPTLRFRPDVGSLKDTPIIEQHFYFEDEFRAEAEKRGWDNWKKIKPMTARDKTYFVYNENKIPVFEAYFPKKKGDNYFIMAYDGTILASMRTESPYKDIWWDKIDGRTMGRGVIENNFEEQIYLNRMVDYKAEGLYWTSKHLYQTRDMSVKTNLLTETDNGEIFRVNDEIKPIQNEERNLGFYNYEEGRIENNAYRKSFVTEPISGGEAKAGTPFRSTFLQAQMASSFYNQKKQNMANFIKEILWDWVLPEFHKEKKGEHSILIKNLLDSSSESDNFFKMILDEKMNKLKGAEGLGSLTPQQWEIRRAIQSKLLKRDKMTIPKSIYENLKYKINIIITGEEVDIGKRTDAYQTILQMVGSNPTIRQDKLVMAIVYEMLNLIGVSPKDLPFEEPEQALEDILVKNRGGGEAQVGGSLPAPSNAMPVPANVQTKV